MENNEWKFRPRLYPHFDHVIYCEQEVITLIQRFQSTKHYSFLPFIECPQEFRRFSKYLEKMQRIETSQETSDVIINKLRPIKYASHQDTQIFSYYRAILASRYESILNQFNLTNNVIAYRKIPTHENPRKNKCNIHYAKEAFDEIVKRGDAAAITLDIKGFFESLEHAFLYKKWCQILGNEELPKDHQLVFKNITDYSVVNQHDCYESLGLISRDGKKKKFLHCPFYIFKHKKKLCSSEEYRTKIVGQGLVQKNDYGMKAIPQGIPQGSPISDVLANMYMLDFDIKMATLAEEKGAYYRRYSDDILWICSPEDAESIEIATKEYIKKQGNGTLLIGEEKTTRTKFFKTGMELNFRGDLFSYLGFSFDGKRALYRDKTISNYMRETVFSIGAFVKRAHEKGKRNRTPLKANLNISQIYHKVGYLNKEYIAKKHDDKKQSPANNQRHIESNFMTYHLRAMYIFNKQPSSQFHLSDQQLRNYKSFVRKKIITAARKYDPHFTL